MNRLFTKNSTGISPDGVWFAGDVNALQDAVAALEDLTQNLQVATMAIGESGLQLVRYASGEARLTGALRVDGILRGLGGLYAGAFTTTNRNALSSPPYGLIILNTTSNRYEWNAGTSGSPSWLPVGPTGPWATSDIVNSAVTTAKIADGAVTAPKITVPYCLLSQVSGQTVPGSTATALSFDFEVSDAYAWHESVSNPSRITPTISGLLEIGAGVGWPSPSEDGGWAIWIRKNGATVLRGSGSRGTGITTPGPMASVSVLDICNGTGDYYEAFVTQTHSPSGGSAVTVPAETSLQAVFKSN